ncbi:MAG: beta-lactamase family protein, partial [Actinomycetota bacterium]|nr:beta-lactamase family protein [Actinomycetota bacterium]
MWIRYRRWIAHAMLAAAVVGAVAGCNASRPSAAPIASDPGPGPPVEQSGDDSTNAPTSPSPPTITADGFPAQPTSTSDSTFTGTTTTEPADESPLAPVGSLPRPSEAEWLAFDSYLQDRLLNSGDYAFGVAVSIDGESVHVASYGDRNTPDFVPPPPEPEGTTDPSVLTIATTTTTTTPPPPLEPVDSTDRFRLASLSKVVTGIVVLQLVEDGELGLDQAVGGLLGDALGVDVSGRPVEAITVRGLLSHTTGFNP